MLSEMQNDIGDAIFLQKYDNCKTVHNLFVENWRKVGLFRSPSRADPIVYRSIKWYLTRILRFYFDVIIICRHVAVFPKNKLQSKF